MRVRGGGGQCLVYAVALRLLYGSLDCRTDTLYGFSLRRGWWCQSSLGIAKVITFNMKRTAAQPQERGYGMSVCECVPHPLSPFLFVRARIKINADISHIFLRLAMDAVECGRERGSERELGTPCEWTALPVTTN